MIIKKLERMPYAQAHVEIDENGAVYLFSYNTLVAGVDADGFAWCNGLYSMTTRKHIGAFAAEYATPLAFQDFKLMAKDGCKISNKTGEVVFLGDEKEGL